MEERMRLLAFIASIIGLVALYFLCSQGNIQMLSETGDNDIQEDMVSLEGKVANIIRRGNTTTLYLDVTETYQVIIFDDIELEAEKNVEIIAQKDEDSLIAHRIRTIK